MRETDPDDPKGLIREAFRIEGISPSECRSIFVDWALSLSAPDPKPSIEALLSKYRSEPEDHPMKSVLRDGLSAAPAARRRGGRAAAVARQPTDE